jgi:hypothetical protein
MAPHGLNEQLGGFIRQRSTCQGQRASSMQDGVQNTQVC